MVKKWSQRIVWTLVGLFVACIWGEIVTRAFFPQNVDTILDILQHDAVCGYIYEPNVSIAERGRGYDVPFETNSVGLRDREVQPKQSDVYRILLIGNSFSVSHGIAIEESFSRAMEKALNARSGDFAGYSAVEVINGSNAGYNAYNYWKGYTRWAPELEPDAVLVGFVPGREYACDPEGTQYIVRDGLVQGKIKEGQTALAPRANPLRKVRKSLSQNSHLYVLLRNYLYYNETIDRLTKRGDGSDTAMKYLKPYVEPLAGGVRAGWDRAYGHLSKLRDEARGDGAQLIVAAIPEITQIDRAHLENLRVKTGTPPEQVNQGLPTRELRSFCGTTGIPLLDPGAAVARVHENGGAYLFDNHWNAAGIAAAAEEAVRQWQQAGLPPFGESGDR